uniref:Prohibitin n=1 Tax=Parastrongyloides trichosuri TaxID=131310 RepID=A0A0N4ZB41_PARTI
MGQSMNEAGEATLKIQSPIHDKTFVDEYANVIVRGGIITTGIIGLAVYLKTSPSFRRFKHVNQIPKIFFEKEIEMKGIVKNITPTGKFYIEHIPLIKVPFINTSKNIKPINVKLAGVDVNEEGLNMIKNEMNIINKTVNFKVIKKSFGDKDSVDCDMIVKTTPLTSVNLSQDLIRKGFAKVPKPNNDDHIQALEKNKAYAHLISRLLESEKIADRRGVGVWERKSWVEAVQTIPSQTVNYVRGSPIIKAFVCFLYIFL